MNLIWRSGAGIGLPVLPGRARLATGCLLVALLLTLILAAPARAHGLAIGQSDITEAGDGIVGYDLAVTYAELAKRVPRLEAPGYSDAGADPDRLTALRAAQSAVASYVSPHVRVLRGGDACADTLEAVATVRHRGELFAVLELTYRCPASASGPYEVRYELFFDDRSEVDHTAHASLVEYDLAGVTGRFVFEPATQQLQVAAPGGAAANATALSLLGIGGFMGLAASLRRHRRRRRRFISLQPAP